MDKEVQHFLDANYYQILDHTYMDCLHEMLDYLAKFSCTQRHAGRLSE